jgi:serine/threonine protein kinase
MVPAGNVASQGSTQIATSSPSLGREDVEGEILYKNDRTIVTVAGERTVRKTIRSDSLYNAAQQWQKEQRILETLSHQHVVKMIAKDSCKYTFTFEHGGKDLSSIKTELGFFNVNDDTVQWRIWRQSALALEYLHNQKNIRHGDIKPHNILLSDDHQITRICDFGHAQNTSEVWKGGGTEWYIPPEILNTGTVDRAADIWALGVTMLFVFKKICLPGMPGATRWEISKLGCKEGAEEDKKMLQWMQELRAARNMLPPKLDLLRKMLDPNPEKRITAKALSMKLNELAVEQQDLVEPTCSLIPLLRT